MKAWTKPKEIKSVFPCHFACFTLSLHFFRYIVNKRNKERSVHFIFNGMVFCVVEWRQRKRTFMNTTKPTLKDRGSLRSFLSLHCLSSRHEFSFVTFKFIKSEHAFTSLPSLLYLALIKRNEEHHPCLVLFHQFSFRSYFV